MGASGLPAYDAVVLAGGTSRRLGGVDKTTLLVGGRPLLDRVLVAVSDAGRAVVVGTPRRTCRPVVWTREQPPQSGPAAALARGLAQVEAPLTAVLAGDLPFLDPASVALLREQAAGHDGAVLVDDEGREQWLTGVWATPALQAAAAAAGDLVGAPLRRVLGDLDVARVATPPRADPPAWFDCDTHDDLREAREHA